VSAAARSYFDELVRGGVRVFEYQPRMLHGKALLIDDDTVLLGSANFDPRSFRLNFELAVLVGDGAFARRFEQVWSECLALSEEVLAGRPKAPFPRRLGEAWARLLSPLL
jgi:cardiolipin synthase